MKELELEIEQLNGGDDLEDDLVSFVKQITYHKYDSNTGRWQSDDELDEELLELEEEVLSEICNLFKTVRNLLSKNNS